MHRLFLLLLFCLPFELPIVEVSHGLFKSRLGPFYPVVSVGIPLCIVAWLMTLSANQNRMLTKYWPLGLLFMTVGLAAVVLTPFTSDPTQWSENERLAFQELLFGYVMPVGMGAVILSLPSAEQLRAWRYFYGGFVVFLALSAIPWVMTYRSAGAELQNFSQLSVSEQMVRSRYIFDDWNYYFKYMGNTNKTSNYLLMSLLCSVRLLKPSSNGKQPNDVIAKRILLWFWGLGSVTLLILLSRLALMLFPIVLFTSGITRFLSKRFKWAIGLLLASCLLYFQGGVLTDYVLNSNTSGDEGKGVFGTGYNRLEQWNELFDYLNRRPECWLFGMGTGGYGLHFFNEPLAGTHNLFFDTWLESGLFGLAVFVLLVVLMFVQTIDLRRLHIRDKLSAVAVLILIMLMIREHSPAYLAVTSMGGVCFAMIFCTIAEFQVLPRINFLSTKTRPSARLSRLMPTS